MSRWPMVRLGDLCELLGGGTPSRKNEAYFSGKIPWVTVKDFKSVEIFDTEDHITDAAVIASSTRMLPANTVLLVTRVGVGKVALAKIPVAINQDIKAVIPKTEILNTDFLLWVLLTKSRELERVAVGATVKGVTLGQVRELPIPLPPLAEQRRIVDLLNHAAGIRRLRQQALETARALIPALFVKMLGDPARNEKGWEVTELGNLVVDGPQNGLYKHISSYGDGTPILRIDAFYDGAITDLLTLRRLRLTADEIERYGLCEDDIVINRVNSPEYLGKSAIVPALPEPTVFESNMMRFSVDPKIIASRYLIQYLQTGFIKQQILGRAKHAINQSSINQQDVKSFPVMVPPITLQQTFAAHVSDLHALITQQERHLVQAEALLQSLMARFFGGSLECGDTSPLYQSADMSAHAKEPIESAVVPAHSKTTPCRRFDSTDISAPSQIAAEASAAYTAGGQAALPAANQPVPARILAAMSLDRDYSRAELLAATGISAADWTGAIRQLKEEGRVIQAGEKRGARYQLAKKGGRR